MVAITVVLAAVLYIMVSGMLGGTTEVTPHAPLTFREDDNINGVYYGTFDGSVKLSKLEISVLDISIGDSVVLRPDEAEYAEVTGGLNVTIKDKNANDKLDANDMFKIMGGQPDDQVTIMYIPTGGTVSTITLT
jgi:FlaG/FlaF family flagellin (archaellin)